MMTGRPLNVISTINHQNYYLACGLHKYFFLMGKFPLATVWRNRCDGKTSAAEGTPACFHGAIIIPGACSNKNNTMQHGIGTLASSLY
jgi:hypothetical protein